MEAVMQTHHLVAHPAHPPLAATGVEARWRVVGPWLQLRWKVSGAGRVVLPPFAGRERADGLWRTTCAEMFVKAAGAAGYSEFNFSPSEAFATYDFTAWRVGMSERPISAAPVITPRQGGSVLFLDVALPLADLPRLPLALSLTLVLEEEGGVVSYWAMAHPHADRPDFHHPACFAATLVATGQDDIRPH